jgi:putative spermidine/putrescine transport system permease protein
MHRRFPHPLLCLFTALVLVLLVAPILAILPLSLSAGELLILPVPGYSLRWYQALLQDPRWLLAARNSLLVGAGTLLLATPLGTAAALGLYLGRFRGRGVVLALLTLPLAAPVVVSALALYFAFALVGLAQTLPGLVLAHSVLALPYVVVAVLASLQGFDRWQLRAAASLGAAPLHAFRRVLLPAIAPGVGTGAVFAFATSFDELVVTLFVAGPQQLTLPRQIYAGVHDALTPAIAAAAVVLVLCSLLFLVLQAALRPARGSRP